jgi:hypothetical protein
VNLVDVLGLACWLEIVDWLDTPQWGEYDGSVYTVYSYPPEPIYAWVCDSEPDWVIGVGGGGGGGGLSGGGSISGSEDYGKIVMMDKMVVTANRIKNPLPNLAQSDPPFAQEESDWCKELRSQVEAAYTSYQDAKANVGNAFENSRNATKDFYDGEGAYAKTAIVDAAGSLPGVGGLLGGGVGLVAADYADKISVATSYGSVGVQGYVGFYDAADSMTHTTSLHGGVHNAQFVTEPKPVTIPKNSVIRIGAKVLGPITAAYNYTKYFFKSHQNRLNKKQAEIEIDRSINTRDQAMNKYYNLRLMHSRSCP